MLIKSTDTVLMALARKGLASGAIKGLTVCCFTVETYCCVLLYYAEQSKSACWW
ncbi:unnamed protein product [Staurois parvus]|uniref:Uncharacterized protein n=1 Tax=Staurois parvus TaxID=386267 RepID=A0ABN9D398_9NEOB|nr:unnamed protein product [Staurois parvus]